MDLIQKLKSLGEDVLKSVPTVNKGGCAVYGAQVASALERRQVKVWGVAMGPGSADIDLVRAISNPRKLEEWNRSGVFFSHILIQFEHQGITWTHDAKHTLTDFDARYSEYLIPGRLQAREIRLLASGHEGWNETFNRARGIPAIRERVQKYLTD